MRHETELFFNDIVENDRSISDLFNADYTFVNERLARHYGIPNVSGPEFRKVTYPDSTRRGILGQGSMLVQTSIADRTSPVLRGKWVMEVLLGSPPPPPPPGVPALEETKGTQGWPPAHDAGAHGDPSREPDVQRVPSVHGSDRPVARQLRRDGQVPVSRERIAARYEGPALRRHRGDVVVGPHCGAAQAADPARAQLHGEPDGVRRWDVGWKTSTSRRSARSRRTPKPRATVCRHS